MIAISVKYFIFHYSKGSCWFLEKDLTNLDFSVVLKIWRVGNTLWLAGEVLDGHDQIVDFPTHVRTARKRPPAEETGRRSAESTLMSPS